MTGFSNFPMLTGTWRVANIFCALKRETEIVGIVSLRISLYQEKGERSTCVDWYVSFNLPKGKKYHDPPRILRGLVWIEFTRGWMEGTRQNCALETKRRKNFKKRENVEVKRAKD